MCVCVVVHIGIVYNASNDMYHIVYITYIVLCCIINKYIVDDIK